MQNPLNKDLSEMHKIFQELIPAVRYIFCAEPQHKRMPLPSGLGHSFSKEVSTFNISQITFYIQHNEI